MSKGQHSPGAALWHRFQHLPRPHSHNSADRVDETVRTSAEGIRALWVSLVALGITAALQAFVVLLSGSVALLGDTLHNAADALTVVPLGIAFVVGRRAATRRYTYGFGRAEDLAGVIVVLFIAGSALLVAYQSVVRLTEPRPLTYLGVVALAGLIGFAGNEWVARYRIKVGRRIGSAALVADGLHARADGLTSLAVLLGAGGAAIGWQWADPVVGLGIAVAIGFTSRDAAREVWRRLMDAIDPALFEAAEEAVASAAGVLAIRQLRLRWIGHCVRAEVGIVVDHRLSLVEAHAIAVEAEHALLHAIPRLVGATVHTDPAPANDDVDHHAGLAHHR